MIILNDKERRILTKVDDKLSELEPIVAKKDKVKNDVNLQNATKYLFLKAGELMKSFRDTCRDIFKEITDFKDLTGFRDILAHREDSKIDLNIVISSLDEVSIIKGRIETLISQSYSEDENICSFELFGGVGTQKERQKYIDALLERLTSYPTDDYIKFPQGNKIKGLSDATEAIINHQELLNLSHQNSEISKEISQEVVKWAKSLYSEILKNNPFETEENFFNHVSTLEINKFSKQLSAIKKELLNVYNETDFNFNFFTKKNRELIDAKKTEKLPQEQFEKIIEHQEALKLSFLNDWENKLTEKRLKHELELIDNARRKFVQSLYKRIEDYLALKELLSPFTNDFGRLWDLSGGIWNKTGFDVLKKYNDLLEKDESIRELANLLGRYRKSEKEVEETFYSETIIKQEWKIKHAQKNEFVGIRESNDLNTLLPVEISLLADVDTETIFYKKFAEKKLLTYDYNNLMSVSENESNEISKEKEENKGPIIICVDTSGSMKGTPEQVAKMLSFALLKIAMKGNRKCYLISFSNEVSTLDLSTLPDSIENLINFLSMSFSGGTDATPAFEETLNLIQGEDFRKADILFISDFVILEIEDELEDLIEEAQSNKTSFHSLTIGSSGNNKVLDIFDNHWIFQPNDLKSLVKDLRKFQ